MGTQDVSLQSRLFLCIIGEQDSNLQRRRFLSEGCLCKCIFISSGVASPKFSPAMQISKYHFFRNLLFSQSMKHKKICLAGLNIRAGYATDYFGRRIGNFPF